MLALFPGHLNSLCLCRLGGDELFVHKGASSFLYLRQTYRECTLTSITPETSGPGVVDPRTSLHYDLEPRICVWGAVAKGSIDSHQKGLENMLCPLTSQIPSSLPFFLPILLSFLPSFSPPSLLPSDNS